jgi:two-component system, OmpR family, sensor histidine kinase VicK
VAFPTTNAFRRNVRIGMSILLLKEGYAKNKVKLRILTPIDNQIMQTIGELKSILPQVDVRATDEGIESRITIVLADRKECIIVEIKDDTKDNLYEAAGLSIYSNSNSIVSSYLSIFESLLKQTQLVINDVNNQTGFRNDNDRTVLILFEPKQDLFVKQIK